eukprot:gene3141-1446_t
MRTGTLDYVGCYKDYDPRALPHVRGLDVSAGHLTANCIQACFTSNQPYAGLQAGRQCFCGTSYDRYWKESESSCSSQCQDSTGMYCGGSWRNSVYRTGHLNIDLCTNASITKDPIHYREQFSEVTCKQDFWKIYSKVTNKGKRTKIGPLKSKEGELIVGDKEKAEVMNDFYANIGREISQTFTQNNGKEIEHVYRITPTVQDPSYDRDVLLKQLRKISPHKASGPDSVTSRELKILQGSIVNSLEIIFKSSFQQSVFPRCWKIARIKSSFKKGKKQERTNYRPLSMLSIPSKVLESQICNTVDSHCGDSPKEDLRRVSS